MILPAEFALLASQAGFDALQAGFVLTMLALAFLVRQPPKAGPRKGGK
ncbi:MAG TPA: hypothetical protein VMU04_21310 [Candidatus Acidoferrum sp.]|nr:hypothetical protein [Candidatus Acidoferrum sp.]